MAPRRKKQPHPPRVARHQAPPSPAKPRPRPTNRCARLGIATMIVLATVAQLSHLPMLSNRNPTQQSSGLFTRIWSSAQQRAGHYGLSSEVTVAQRACGKCDATTLHIAIRSDLSRDGAERRDGARRTWLRWLKGLEGVSYQFFVVDAHETNRTGLQNDLVKEYDLHKDVGVEVLSGGDELSAELRVVSRILAEKKVSHVLATNDRSLLCVHRIREEIKKRPLFQFAWTKFQCVAPANELPPLQLADGFLLLTRDVAQLLAKLSDSGKRSLDVAALLPLLSVTTLDDQTRLASPSTTSDHVQMLYDQTRSRAFRPKQMHFCQKYVAALDVGSRKWFPATPRPTFMPTPKPSRRPSPRPTRPPRRFFEAEQPEEPVPSEKPPERGWLSRLWSGRRLRMFELVRPQDDDVTLGDTAIAQHDDDAPREPKLAPENDDDAPDASNEAEAWLDQGKVPEGDWLDAGVENDVSGDESDDDAGDDGVNLDTEGDDALAAPEAKKDWAYENDPPRLRGTDARLQRLQKMREKLLGAETAAKLEKLTTPAPRMVGGRPDDDDAPLVKKKKKKTAWGSSLFTWKAVTPAPHASQPLIPASVQINKPGPLRSLVFGTMGLQGGAQLTWSVGAPQYAALGPLCGTPPLRTFRAPRVTEAEALSRRDQRRRSLTAGIVDSTRKTAVASLLVERFTETASESQVAQVQPKLMACSFSVDCLLPTVSSTIVKLWWSELQTPKLQECCPERALTLKTCGAYQTRTFRPESSKPAVLASFPGSGNTWTRLLLEHASGYYTGSVYDDVDLMRLLPAEGVDSGAVLVVKAHLNPAKYMPQTTAERIILLVRHPFDAIWSEYNRRIAGGHANAAGERDVTSPRFAMFARCMGCKWMRLFCGVLSLSPTRHVCSTPSMRHRGRLYAHTGYAMMHADLASSGRAVRVLRYEDLVRSTEPTLRAMLRFLEIDNVDSNRIDCAKQLSDDPSVKRIKKRSATELMGNYTPGLACGLWRQISGSEQAKLLLATMGYREPRVCAQQASRSGTSFFCDLADVSAMSEGRGDNCGGNLVSPRPMVRSSRSTTSSSKLQLRPRVIHVRGTQSKPRETALDRARKRAAEQRAARNERPAAGSWLAQQQRAEAVKRRRAKKKKRPSAGE